MRVCPASLSIYYGRIPPHVRRDSSKRVKEPDSFPQKGEYIPAENTVSDDFSAGSEIVLRGIMCFGPLTAGSVFVQSI